VRAREGPRRAGWRWRLAQPVIRLTLRRQFAGYCATLKQVLEAPARTEENVATASTSVPPAVADEAIVGQSAIRRDGQRL
jgi:hypothetical protein